MASLAQVLPGHSRWVHDCCWSTDGGYAFSAGFDNTALVHHTVTGLCGGSSEAGSGAGGEGPPGSSGVTGKGPLATRGPPWPPKKFKEVQY